ncbi:hypothetical protein MMC21_004500 [Puttea exsequens]|nr:hypothetical protein [Puttea exsequens]
MSSYAKLTVAKLKEELDRRGLPKAGLKAALVQRLEEADAAPEEAETEEPEPKERASRESAPQETKPGESEPEKRAEHNNDPVRSALVQQEVESTGYRTTAHNESQLDTGPAVTNDTIRAGGDDVSAKEDKDTSLRLSSETIDASKSPLDVRLSPSPNAQVPTQKLPALDDKQDDVLPGILTQPASAQGSVKEVSLPTPNLTQPEQTQLQDGIHASSTQVSTAGDEIQEDSRKRKRRSQTPPPSSIETQKRLRSEGTGPHVELPEDLQNATPDDTLRRIPSTDGSPDPPTNVHQDRDEKSGKADERIVTPPPNASARNGGDMLIIQAATDARDFDVSETTGSAAKADKDSQSDVKISPSDARFKNLFTAQTKAEPSSQQAQSQEHEDRAVRPALHSASSALYIRELMRPLKPEAVKDYLATLATPPEVTTDADIVTDFFLDSIRTHCLVKLANIAAAARVRSSLHDRVWPNERDRRPLFVDFVPEEKITKWIAIEQDASSGRGQPTKKWEVVYEDEDGKVEAYLQEVGSSSGGIAAKAAKTHAAPSATQCKESDTQTLKPKVDEGKGFQALDDLFKSTAAKPKLYYQPMSKSVVGKRRDLLDAGRGGGRSDEMRRFSFEDDTIVDRGPEFGNRGRGGFRGRGGYGGGYRGRGGGGGYRDDSYRGGDSWRDRRSGY